MLPTLATCRSRVAVLYTIFSLACALALLLLLAEIFNYPLGLKVGGMLLWTLWHRLAQSAAPVHGIIDALLL